MAAKKTHQPSTTEILALASVPTNAAATKSFITGLTIPSAAVNAINKYLLLAMLPPVTGAKRHAIVNAINNGVRRDMLRTSPHVVAFVSLKNALKELFGTRTSAFATNPFACRLNYASQPKSGTQ